MLRDIYYANSQIPERYLQNIKLQPATVDLETFEALNNIRNNVVEFVKSGKSILICSNKVGNGKSSWGTKILKQYIKEKSSVKVKNNCPALFINVTNFLNKKKIYISNYRLQHEVQLTEQNILESPLVMFDDIGVKNISDFDLGALYYWIDDRTSRLKSCIYTSNLLPNQLKTVLDERLYSRIVNYSDIYEIKDGDSRIYK